jgi:Flp pilus assembly protein TadD
VIALEVGDRARALSSVDDAIGRRPDDWLLYMQKAKVLLRTNPAGARQALAEARRLNPRGPEIEALSHRLGVAH